MKIRPENLRAFLDAKKGAATEIAKRLGVSKGLVSQWKHGIEHVTEDHNHIIAEILDRSLDDLCKPFSPVCVDGSSSEDMQLLIKLARQLSADALNELLTSALQLSRSYKQSRNDP